MENVYQRQLTAIERRVSLRNEKENLGKRLDSQQGTLIAQPPPYNLSRYDSLLDELKTTKQQKQAITIALKSAKKVFEDFFVNGAGASEYSLEPDYTKIFTEEGKNGPGSIFETQ